MTADTTAHTFGAWTELTASTPYDSSAMLLGLQTFFTINTATGTILDIGIGASGSEQSVCQLAVGSANVSTYAVPVFLPAGSRVSARIQSVVTGGKTGIVAINYLPSVGDFLPATYVDVYGVDLSTSRGVNLAASNAWTQITASTSRAYRMLTMIWSASNTNTGGNLTGTVSQLGVGLSGSETVLGTGKFGSSTSTVIANQSYPLLIVENVPAGSRLVARQNSARTMVDVTVIGVPYA